MMESKWLSPRHPTNQEGIQDPEQLSTHYHVGAHQPGRTVREQPLKAEQEWRARPTPQKHGRAQEAPMQAEQCIRELEVGQPEQGYRDATTAMSVQWTWESSENI